MKISEGQIVQISHGMTTLILKIGEVNDAEVEVDIVPYFDASYSDLVAISVFERRELYLGAGHDKEEDG